MRYSICTGEHNYGCMLFFSNAALLWHVQCDLELAVVKIATQHHFVPVKNTILGSDYVVEKSNKLNSRYIEKGANLVITCWKDDKLIIIVQNKLDIYCPSNVNHFKIIIRKDSRIFATL